MIAQELMKIRMDLKENSIIAETLSSVLEIKDLALDQKNGAMKMLEELNTQDRALKLRKSVIENSMDHILELQKKLDSMTKTE